MVGVGAIGLFRWLGHWESVQVFLAYVFALPLIIEWNMVIDLNVGTLFKMIPR